MTELNQTTMDKENQAKAAPYDDNESLASDALGIGGQVFYSRLFLGTGKYGQLSAMQSAISAAETNLVTVALRRMDAPFPAKDKQGNKKENQSLLSYIPEAVYPTKEIRQTVHLLPNTSGARTAKEAVLAAELSREMMETNFVKLEIHPDPTHLMPDPVETLLAAEALVNKGFIVLPYVHADPVLCKRLEEVGVAAVMPLGAPIGSNLGLSSREFLEIIIENSAVPVIIDAGIGSPSDAALAMEIGADAVLISTAIATAADPVAMATAFKWAVRAGRLARRAGIASKGVLGEATSPLTDFLS